MNLDWGEAETRKRREAYREKEKIIYQFPFQNTKNV